MAQENRKIGRPYSGRETVEKRVPLDLTLSEFSELENKRGDVPRATYIKRLIKNAGPEIPKAGNAVELLGIIACGTDVEIAPLPEGAAVTPPFPLPPDCYALLTVGLSMVGPNPRTSIPPGSIVFMRRDKYAPFGSIVHVEWDERGRRYATLKKLVQMPDGAAGLEPLNHEHDTILPRDESWEVCGTWVRTLVNENFDGETVTVEDARAKVQAAAKLARENAGYYQEQSDGRRRKQA